jgi:cytochrome c nitrite reductase small subunit
MLLDVHRLHLPIQAGDRGVEDPPSRSMQGVPLLGLAALALAALAALAIVGFLVRRPPLTGEVKLRLFLAMLVLPTTAALLGNTANMETTKKVEFCNSCHVMNTYVADARSAESTSLAATHARLELFREDACYGCHADYGMLGGITTKIGGMHHVKDYYLNDWDQPGHRGPELYEPYDLRVCVSCHDPLRAGAPLQHRVHADEIRERSISCAADGCHGPPHPVKFVPGQAR